MEILFDSSINSSDLTLIVPGRICFVFKDSGFFFYTSVPYSVFQDYRETKEQVLIKYTTYMPQVQKCFLHILAVII